MAVKITQSEINVREKLAELDKPSGIAGEAMLRADTPQEQQAIIGMGGRKNLIINGDFKVDQRGGTHTTKSDYTLDRWKFQTDLLDEYTHNVTQSTDAPPGFFNSLAIAVTASEASVASTEDLALSQFIEAQNCQVAELGMTLSFWVKSNVTGTFAVHLSALDPSKIYPSTYTIDHPNVWEKKTIVIPPLKHTINSDNGQGIRLSFLTISGTAYSAGDDINQWSTYTSSLFAAKHQAQVINNADTWKVTGVQLEGGSVATPFEQRSYGEELELCQRYYYKWAGSVYDFCTEVQKHNTDQYRAVIDVPVALRIRPAITWDGLAVWYATGSMSAGFTAIGNGYQSSTRSDITRVSLNLTPSSMSLAAYQVGMLSADSSANEQYIAFDSEL